MQVLINRMNKGDYGKTIAFFDVVIYNENVDLDGVTIKGFKLVDGGNGMFASAPSEKKEVDGETKYYPMVWLGKNLLQQINESAIAKYNEDQPVTQDLDQMISSLPK